MESDKPTKAEEPVPEEAGRQMLEKTRVRYSSFCALNQILFTRGNNRFDSARFEGSWPRQARTEPPAAGAASARASACGRARESRPDRV